MELCAERGWAFVASAVAIRGAAAAMIQFRRVTLNANTRTPPRLFVNSPAGNDYGSPSLGRHYRLRYWADRLVRLHHDASPAAAAGDNRGLAHAR